MKSSVEKKYTPSPNEQVRQVLDLTGFDSLFEIFTDLNQAIASFRLAVPVMETRLP